MAARWRGFAVLVAVLAMVAACPAFTVVYASSTASVQDKTIARLDAQARAQAAIIAQLRAQLLATCGSAGDLGSIPIPASPKPSRLAISLVTNNRLQWRALRCPGKLPAAAELGLDRWARYYRLPAS